MEKETQAQLFSCEVYETFKNIFFIELLGWLLLKKWELNDFAVYFSFSN